MKQIDFLSSPGLHMSIFTLSGTHPFVLTQRREEPKCSGISRPGLRRGVWRWQFLWLAWLGRTGPWGWGWGEGNGNIARQSPAKWGRICGRIKCLGWFMCFAQQTGRGSVFFSKYFCRGRSHQMFGGFWDCHNIRVLSGKPSANEFFQLATEVGSWRARSYSGLPQEAPWWSGQTVTPSFSSLVKNPFFRRGHSPISHQCSVSPSFLLSPP